MMEDRIGIGRVVPLGKGTSSDKKFIVTCSSGRKMLLRFSGMDLFERKKEIAALLKALAVEGIPAQRLLDMGVCEVTNEVYLALEWCEGVDGYAAMPSLTKHKRYELGLRAGAILRKLHTLPAPQQEESWTDRIEFMTRQRILSYRDSGHSFDGDELVMKYLERLLTMIKNRPHHSLRHGDYHFNNIIVSNEKALTLIDWDLCGYGDPWEEFQRTAWVAATSPDFAVGQLHSYFEGDPPDDFFPALAFYMASCAVGSIAWSAIHKKEFVAYMHDRAIDTVYWFEGFQCFYPKWYFPYDSARIAHFPSDAEGGQ